MPDASRPTTGGPIRVRREYDDRPEIEGGWAVVRIEPESGRVVCERDGKRVLCDRREFELLNFPGSDDVWSIVSDSGDADLANAAAAWAGLDPAGAASALLRHARTLDPSFEGIQITFDLNGKMRAAEEACKRSMDLLRFELERARTEYGRFAANARLSREEKERLLAAVRELEDRYAALDYRFKLQLPAWRRLCSAIERLDAIAKETMNIA